MNKCINSNGHKFIPVEWKQREIPSLRPGNTSETEIVTLKTVEEVMCIYCEWFKRINRK